MCINFLQIVVTETGTAEKFSDNATVLLTLINVNDNEPKFQQSSYNYTFAEEIPAGSFIAKITVRFPVPYQYYTFTLSSVLTSNLFTWFVKIMSIETLNAQ